VKEIRVKYNNQQLDRSALWRRAWIELTSNQAVSPFVAR